MSALTFKNTMIIKFIFNYISVSSLELTEDNFFILQCTTKIKKLAVLHSDFISFLRCVSDILERSLSTQRVNKVALSKEVSCHFKLQKALWHLHFSIDFEFLYLRVYDDVNEYKNLCSLSVIHWTFQRRN